MIANIVGMLDCMSDADRCATVIVVDKPSAALQTRAALVKRYGPWSAPVLTLRSLPRNLASTGALKVVVMTGVDVEGCETASKRLSRFLASGGVVIRA